MPAPVTFDVETRVGPRPGGGPASSPGISPPQGAAKSGRSTLFFGGAHQAARAKLTLIRGDGEDGVSFTLAGQEHPAGRGECPISFPDDPFLSPTHANFLYRNGRAPTGATASTFASPVPCNSHRARRCSSASRCSPSWSRINPTMFPTTKERTTRRACRAPRRSRYNKTCAEECPAGCIGREGNDINFPEDPFISGRHAELRLSGGVLSVTDLGSRNGTFVRVNGEQVLRHGDYVFLGQQLLRVEIV
jgi:hypothetical protein